MKSDDLNVVKNTIDFNTDNTFLTDGSKDFLTVLDPEFRKLDSEGKTVIITDPYLFKAPANQPDYTNNLKTLLRNLKAHKLIWSGIVTPANSICYADVIADLNTIGCSLTVQTVTRPFHGRQWICAESKKGITVDTSLNGFQSKIGYVHDTPEDEVEEIISLFGLGNDEENE